VCISPGINPVNLYGHLRPYSKSSPHSKSGSSIWASLECHCCFRIAGGLMPYLTMWLLTVQLFKSSMDTQEKLRLNLHSLSVCEWAFRIRALVSVVPIYRKNCLYYFLSLIPFDLFKRNSEEIFLYVKAWFHERFFSAKCEIFRLFLLNCEHSSRNNLFE
jgi:hypothetical protein